MLSRFAALVVEPELGVRELFGEYLAGRGVRVVLANGLAEARVAWGRGRYDVVVSELVLPDGSGQTLFGELQRDGIGLLATASALSVVDTIGAMHAGADDVLVKPIRLREFYEALRRSAGLGRTRLRERVARELFVGAARAASLPEVSALRAIAAAETPLLQDDPALLAACTLALDHAEERCR